MLFLRCCPSCSLFETGSHYVSLAGLELTVKARLASNARRSLCLYLRNVAVKGMCPCPGSLCLSVFWEKVSHWARCYLGQARWPVSLRSAALLAHPWWGYKQTWPQFFMWVLGIWNPVLGITYQVFTNELPLIANPRLGTCPCRSSWDLEQAKELIQDVQERIKQPFSKTCFTRSLVLIQAENPLSVLYFEFSHWTLEYLQKKNEVSWQQV